QCIKRSDFYVYISSAAHVDHGRVPIVYPWPVVITGNQFVFAIKQRRLKRSVLSYIHWYGIAQLISVLVKLQLYGLTRTTDANRFSIINDTAYQFRFRSIIIIQSAAADHGQDCQQRYIYISFHLYII